LRACVKHQRPYGSESWTTSERERWSPPPSARPRGRPRKAPGGPSPATWPDTAKQDALQRQGEMEQQPNRDGRGAIQERDQPVLACRQRTSPR
jgi:hypothetical protein